MYFMYKEFNILAEKIKAEGREISVDIGCGSLKRANIGIDHFDGPQVDIVTDLNKSLPIPDSSCDSIKMFHSLEHVNEPVHLLMECHRVLKKGGIIEIRVPHISNIRAYEIHHKSYWNSFSLDPFFIKGKKSNESFELFSVESISFTLFNFKWLTKFISQHRFFYEFFLKNIFPAYEVIFVLKKI